MWCCVKYCNSGICCIFAAQWWLTGWPILPAIRASMHPCILASLYVFICASVHPCICSSMRLCICASLHPCIHASVHPCIRYSMRPCIHHFWSCTSDRNYTQISFKHPRICFSCEKNPKSKYFPSSLYRNQRSPTRSSFSYPPQMMEKCAFPPQSWH